MPATSCPAYEIDEDIPVTLMEEYGDRDYLQRKYEDARKRRISYRWSFTEVIEKLPIAPTPNQRPIPSFALDGGQYCFRPISAPKPASFAEAESAQSSQVWGANVFKADSCGPAVQQSQPERVILKILQPSMRPFPDDRGIRLGSPAHQLAYSEEILYKHLRPLQGSHIPYYFGTFLVTLPNGEDAYVLILEYIEGEVLQEWVTEYDTNETRAREVLPVMVRSLTTYTQSLNVF
ncbi:hypothetical protein CPB85DRAFT_245820 [Mucidula mucida]|nr:hypothetical protein CPB85DRAFT_245820 [Mucidula mucida]